eukprot:6175840-Pleurochrysis_carterae.AAC.2
MPGCPSCAGQQRSSDADGPTEAKQRRAALLRAGLPEGRAAATCGPPESDGPYMVAGHEVQ